jgi:hypothetical protein
MKVALVLIFLTAASLLVYVDSPLGERPRAAHGHSISLKQDAPLKEAIQRGIANEMTIRARFQVAEFVDREISIDSAGLLRFKHVSNFANGYAYSRTIVCETQLADDDVELLHILLLEWVEAIDNDKDDTLSPFAFYVEDDRIDVRKRMSDVSRVRHVSFYNTCLSLLDAYLSISPSILDSLRIHARFSNRDDDDDDDDDDDEEDEDEDEDQEDE